MCPSELYSESAKDLPPLTVSESLSDDCLPRTVRLHWTRLVRCAAFYDRCWGLGAATARAKPQAAGDPVSSACGDADGPAVVEVGEAVVLSEGVLPLSTPAVATERCATEVPVTAPWGSPFGEAPPAGSRSGERMVPATPPSAVPGSRPCRLTSRKSAGCDEPVA